jgi:XTP/dITP diphosphohydrolase
VTHSTLLVATTNRGKVREILPILDGLDLRVITLADLGPTSAPEETGATFAENARDKAVYYARTSGLVTAAEDSGLEIEALGGLPGVESARFNGSSYPEKFQAIFRLLDERGVVESPARFVCVVALARGGEVLFEAEGLVHGRIVRAPRGEHGFGYDPIFLYPPFGLTLAEIDADRKAQVSHRGRAFAALRGFLSTWVGTQAVRDGPA